MNKQQLRSLIREEIKKMIKENYFMAGQTLIAPAGKVKDTEKPISGKVESVQGDMVVVRWDGDNSATIHGEQELIRKKVETVTK